MSPSLGSSSLQERRRSSNDVGDAELTLKEASMATVVTTKHE
jgi:hypothetical protein